jgi:hypothetical protein
MKLIALETQIIPYNVAKAILELSVLSVIKTMYDSMMVYVPNVIKVPMPLVCLY